MCAPMPSDSRHDAYSAEHAYGGSHRICSSSSVTLSESGRALLVVRILLPVQCVGHGYAQSLNGNHPLGLTSTQVAKRYKWKDGKKGFSEDHVNAYLAGCLTGPFNALLRSRLPHYPIVKYLQCTRLLELKSRWFVSLCPSVFALVRLCIPVWPNWTPASFATEHRFPQTSSLVDINQHLSYTPAPPLSPLVGGS